MAGLGVLIRLILRRDRVKLPLAIGLFVVLLVAMVPLLQETYGDSASLAALYATLGASPAGLFMTGPMDGPTFGGLMTIETLIWWGIAAAIINTMLVVRHTRYNEEIGAQELIMSGQVHRASSLAAVLAVALLMNLVIGLGVGFGFELVNPGWDPEQSWLYAAAMALFGFVWAGIAAIVVQLVENGRGANGMLAGLIGIGFALRGIGDFMGKTGSDGLLEPHWISSLSPFGWLQATRPLTESEWGPLWVSVIFVAAAIGLAFMLQMRRDVGAGLLPSRKGKLRASKFLSTPLGLTWYLQKNVFIGWLVGVMALAGTIGALTPQMSEIYSESDSISKLLAMAESEEMTSSFLSLMLAITCVLVFAYAIHGLSKIRSEESSGRLESLLATKYSRLGGVLLHSGMVFVAGTIMLVASGLVLAVLTNQLSGLTVDVWEYVMAGLSYAPILLAFIGLYLLLFGFLPRLAGGVVWLYFGFVFFAMWLGPIVRLSQEVMNLSVLEHVATPPAEAIDWLPVAIIGSFALVMTVAGLVRLSRRDIVSS